MFELTLGLIVFLFPLAYSPGPGNMFFAASGAAFGFRSTLAANLGYHIATWIVCLAIGLGFGSLAQLIPNYFEIIRYAGAAYVFYLAGKLISAGVLKAKAQAKPASFWDGAILLLLNPKAYFIMAALSSQFLLPEQGHYIWLVVYVATLFTLNNFVAFSLWTVIGDRLLGYFRSERYAVGLNLFFGVILAGVALWMLLS